VDHKEFLLKYARKCLKSQVSKNPSLEYSNRLLVGSVGIGSFKTMFLLFQRIDKKMIFEGEFTPVFWRKRLGMAARIA